MRLETRADLKKPRLAGPPMPMGMPMVPGGFPGARPPPPPMMGMIPPRPPFPIPGQPPGMYPPRPIGVVPGVPGMPGAPGVPPPMWGAAPPGVVPPRPLAPPGASAPGIPPAALAYMNQQLGVAAGAIPATVPPPMGVVPPPALAQQIGSSQVLAATVADAAAPKSDLGLVYSDNDISMVRRSKSVVMALLVVSLTSPFLAAGRETSFATQVRIQQATRCWGFVMRRVG